MTEGEAKKLAYSIGENTDTGRDANVSLRVEAGLRQDRHTHRCADLGRRLRSLSRQRAAAREQEHSGTSEVGHYRTHNASRVVRELGPKAQLYCTPSPTSKILC